MTPQTHSIDLPATRALVAAFVLIVSAGVVALAAQLQIPSGSWPAPSTESVAEFGD